MNLTCRNCGETYEITGSPRQIWCRACDQWIDVPDQLIFQNPTSFQEWLDQEVNGIRFQKTALMSQLEDREDMELSPEMVSRILRDAAFKKE